MKNENRKSPEILARALAVQANELLDCFSEDSTSDPEEILQELSDVILHSRQMLAQLAPDESAVARREEAIRRNYAALRSGLALLQPALSAEIRAVFPTAKELPAGECLQLLLQHWTPDFSSRFPAAGSRTAVRELLRAEKLVEEGLQDLEDEDVEAAYERMLLLSSAVDASCAEAIRQQQEEYLSGKAAFTLPETPVSPEPVRRFYLAESRPGLPMPVCLSSGVPIRSFFVKLRLASVGGTAGFRGRAWFADEKGESVSSVKEFELPPSGEAAVTLTLKPECLLLTSCRLLVQSSDCLPDEALLMIPYEVEIRSSFK